MIVINPHNTTRTGLTMTGSMIPIAISMPILLALLPVGLAAQSAPEPRPSLPSLTLSSSPERERETRQDTPNQMSPESPGVTLEQLQQTALANNPTLRQAKAGVRAAAGRTRQAGLWPNPTVGYTGEEIRGGSFGGGQQGVFVQQNVILGGKLGLDRSCLRIGAS
jgi:cobalt-zinc-cadmium efflux system outer membrane protein